MSRRPLALALALLAALAPLVPGAAAPATPAGAVQAVSPPGGYFLGPDAAVSSAGEALVVWYGEAAGQATPDLDIYGRVFGPSGAPRGEPFRVNAAPAGQQRRPAVAANPRGGFVAVWDRGTRTVWARRLAADGAPIGDDIPVSQSDAIHRDPDVAVAADGSFVVAWQLTPAQGPDRVALRRFTAEGLPAGAERTPLPGAASQINPALAALPGGAAALAWEQPGAIGLARLDAAGALAAPPATVAAAGEPQDPTVAAGPRGEVLVAWSDAAAGGTIYARAYGPDGAPRGEQAALAPAAAAGRSLPSAAVAADGSALVAWADPAPQGGAPLGVAARAVDAAGAPLGGLVLPRPPAADERPATGVAAAVGPAVGSPLWVVWAQPPAGGSDAASAVYARRLIERLYSVALPLTRR
jgi:hypothetical protein